VFPTLLLAAGFYGSQIAAPPYPANPPLLSTVTVGGTCDGACRGTQLVLGTGEIVGRGTDGTLLVLTARHVIDNIARPNVYVRGGERPGTRFADVWQARAGRPARVVSYASDADLALVAFRPRRIDSYAVATLSDEPWPAMGDVIGDPNGALWIVSPFRFVASASDTFVVDCGTCGPGDSGGGVFDGRGRLAGILIRQRIDPSRLVNGEPQGTSEFQVVAVSKVRAFLAVPPTLDPPPPLRYNPNDPWSRFDAIRGAAY
jgi:hypothetical protein